jgi:methylaspartate ammonia-lyase
MTRIRLALRRLFRPVKPTGPMRFYTRRAADGVFLDLEDYFEHVVTTIADDGDAFALFMEMVKDRRLSHKHDGWEPERLHLEQLGMVVGYEIPVRGQQLARLVARLQAAAPAPVVPAQRTAGAS